MSSVPGNKTVNTSSELATIDAPIGTEIWVVDDQQNWQCVPREPESGGIAGPSTSLRTWWVAVGSATSFGPFASIAAFRAATPPSVLTSFVIEGEGDYVYKPDWGANTSDDSMYVLRSDSVSIASNGRGVRLSTNSNRSPNIYGNRNVARRLLDSLTPATKVTLVRTGDSRAVESSLHTLTGCYGVPWGGQMTATNTLASGPWAPTTYTRTSDNLATVTAAGSYLGHWSLSEGYQVAMLAGTSPAGTLNRMLYASAYDVTLLKPMAAQFIGRACAARFKFLSGPTGVTTNSLQVRLHNAAITVQGTPSAAFGTYSTSEQPMTQVATLPTSWNWSTNPSVTATLICVTGQETRLGEFVYCGHVVIESDIGVTYVNASVGGRTVAGFLTDNVFAPTLWSQDVAAMSGEKVLWFSLGTNGLAFGGRNAWLTDAQALIARFRTAQPNGYVLIDTSYDKSTNDGGVAELQCAARKLCELDGRVMAIDTAAEMGGYPFMLAAGLFGGSPDGLHFVDAGKNELVKTIGKMLTAAASAD